MFFGFILFYNLIQIIWSKFENWDVVYWENTKENNVIYTRLAYIFLYQIYKFFQQKWKDRPTYLILSNITGIIENVCYFIISMILFKIY